MSTIDEKADVKKNEKDNASGISKSKQKRIDREARQKKSKRDDLVGMVIGVAAILLIIGAVVASIVSSAMKNASVITPSDDFGRYLTDAGFVKGVNASGITTLPADYNSIQIPRAEIELSDEEFEEAKTSQLELHEVYSDDETAEIKNGDKINLDFVGSIDGVEFEGGNSGGNGYDLEIGSGSFIPGFEDQLVGHKKGEVFDIDVTFPDDYGSADVAGKDAVFTCTINGIYVTGTFDDAFVKEYLSESTNGADTVEAYRKYLNDQQYDGKVREYIQNYVFENSTLNKFPKNYLKQLKRNQKFNDISTYEYMNQMFASMYGQGYSSFEEYTGLTEEAYDASLEVTCKETEKQNLVLQAIAEKENISVTDDEIKAYVEDNFGPDSYETQLETYKKPYLAQRTLKEKVIKMLIEKATVN